MPPKNPSKSKSKSKCQEKKCPVGKVCNPATGRCIKVRGGTPKSSKSKCQEKKCPVGKVCNPATGRCIKVRGGAPPKSSNSRKSNSLKKSNSRDFKLEVFQSTAGTIEKYLLDHYNGIMPLDKGQYGEVYTFNYKGADRVLKVLSTETRFSFETSYKEIFVQKKFAEMGLAPQIYSARIVALEREDMYRIPEKYTLIEMEKIDGNLEKLMKYKLLSPITIEKIMREILTMISVYQMNGYSHGDLHWGNIGYKVVGKNSIRLYLIDFGLACCVYSETLDKETVLYDTTQLLRTKLNLNNNVKNVKNVNKWLKLFYEEILSHLEKDSKNQIGAAELSKVRNLIDKDVNREDLQLYEKLYIDIFYKEYSQYLDKDIFSISMHKPLENRKIIYRYIATVIDLE